MEPGFADNTAALVMVLDQLDYFQILKIDEAATPGQIKEAFHRESRQYHPDRFHAAPDEQLKQDVNRLYKRVTEAYFTLRDDAKRQKYLADLNGPDRSKKLRFTEADDIEAREQQKRAKEEQIGTSVRGRQLYQQAQRDLAGEKLEAGIRNLKLALSFEPQNALFKAKLAEAEAAFKAAWQKSR